MIVKTLIRKNEYKDSVQLMQAASSVLKIDGIDTASLMMGTDNNKLIFADSNLLTDEIKSSSPNDIAIVIRAETEAIAELGLEKIIETIDRSTNIESSNEFYFKSTRGAIQANSSSNLVVISVAGEYATREAKIALEYNKNVFLFSDNVPIKDEIALKLLAEDKGLIVMGPDCGTAIINGISIGFANNVRKGSIGVVGASGTGMQEISSLIHQQGRGISHAIGTGGRDISNDIGGLSTLAGLDVLANDSATDIIVIVSKPPDDETKKKIIRRINTIEKPVVINFLGSHLDNKEHIIASTLETAAFMACALDQKKNIQPFKVWDFNQSKDEINQIVHAETQKLLEKQKYIRGLFAGGTFTSEAIIIASNSLNEPIYSNLSGPLTNSLSNLEVSTKHTIIDLGDDSFTVGRPHPMIDQTYRKKRMIKEAEDSTTAVILLDFILGYGAHLDPIGDIIETIEEIRAQHHYISIIAHVCGTDNDPQDYSNSIKKLQSNQVIIMPTNAQAARMAALITSRGTANVWK